MKTECRDDDGGAGEAGAYRRTFLSRILFAAAALLPAGAALGQAGATAGRGDRNLEAELAELKARLGRLEDEQAIRKLHHAYGYYLDKCLYQEVVDLFADDGEVRFMGGIFRGREGVRRLYIETFRNVFTAGRNGPVPGFLLDHPQMQDVVDVSADRRTGRGRFRCLMQAGTHVDSDAPMAQSVREGRAPQQWWEGGIYENEYVRKAGVWKIKLLNYRPIWHAEFDKGWAYTRPEYIPAFSETYPDNPLGPDELDPDFPGLWPVTDTVPFHYAHPVTGKPWS